MPSVNQVPLANKGLSSAWGSDLGSSHTADRHVPNSRLTDHRLFWVDMFLVVLVMS